MNNQRKRKRIIKRLISGVSAIALSVGLLGSIPASADDSTVGYKYTLFAYSSEEGAISSSAANFCVNGNIATNGTISAGQNFNVNGEKKEHSNEAMPDLTKAITEKFFDENVDVKTENYSKNETNIEVKVPTDVKGKAELNGNIQLSAGLKAMGDIALSGNVLNKNSTVLFSENGNIVINTENANLTGLIYAPKGNIVIDSKNLNLNSILMIANKITLNAPNVNINSNAEMAKFVQEAIDKNNNNGSGGEEDPVTDPAIYAYGEYNEETKSVDIEWYSNVTGEFAVLESMNGTDYTVVSKVPDDTKYSIKVASDFIKRFYKVTTIKDGKTIESIPFSIVNANGKYSTELLDTDKDGLADLYEEMFGTDKTLPDTDKDGLTDYEEVYITNTDPTKYDSVTEGVSDADADNDKDGLTNKREIKLKTDPNRDDTDGDNLKDGDEISKYNTDPTKRDTDGDELEDDDELKFKYDPNKQDTDGNGIIDSKEKNNQTLDVVPDNKEQAVTKVSVSMAATGNIEKTTTVESIMDKDVLCSNVVGLVGEPFSIESKSSFDKATITFTVDKTKLGETEFDNLMFLWYDRENDNFVELETSHDAANSSVSIETTHFSEYMIVDSKQWFENWKEIESDWKKHTKSTSETLHVFEPIATVVFSHCTNDSDPDFLNPDSESTSTTINHQTNYRTLICEHLIDSLSAVDAMEFVQTRFNIFNQSSFQYQSTGFTNDKEYLKNEISYFMSGSYVKDNDITTVLRILSTTLYTSEVAKDIKDKRIVFITSSDFSFNSDELISYTREKANGLDYYQMYKSVPVYFVRIGDFGKKDLDKTNIKKIADETGGKVYDVATLNELYTELGEKNHVSNVEDYDKDGFSDMEETYGLIVDSSGTRYKTKLDKDDSDDDGLKDNEEVDVNRIYRLAVDKNGKEVWKCFHNMHSIPTKQDSDGDDIKDKDDKNPMKFDLKFMDSLKKMEKYIDEAKKSDDEFRLSESDYNEYIATKDKPNYFIALNIIRSIRYGSSKGEDKNSIIEKISWRRTCGPSFNVFRDYINKKDPKILNYFMKYNSSNNMNKEVFKDPYKQDVDFIHMTATLSAYFNPDSVVKNNKELSGWAGDLQSLVLDLKTEYYGIDINLNEAVYNNLITKEGTKFSMPDMLADVDAENIYHLYSGKDEMYLSEMFEDYYNSKEYYKKRYSIFVDGYGGINNLEKRTNEFTSGNEVIKHRNLNKYAKIAAEDVDVKSRYYNSYLGYCPIPHIDTFGGCYITYQAIYSLPEPSKVTEEESKALTYAFIKFMKVKL